MAAQHEWTAWLASPDCRPALAAAAQFIFRQALRLALPPELLPCVNPWQLPPDERTDCLQALADDLWIFLRSRPPGWYRKHHWAPLAARGGRLLMLKIAQEFLTELKEKARTYARDPGRALYRRLRRILQEEAEVAYRATSRGAFFSFEPEAAPWEAAGLSGVAGYGEWESPLRLVSLQELDRRPSLLALSRLFWEEACRQQGKRCYLPVRELVRFIAAHYPGFSPVAVVSLEEGGAGTAPDDRVMAEHDGGQEGERSWVRLQLNELARQLAATWSQKQRTVFLLIQGRELTLAQAAAEMGYRSAAGADYVYHSALDGLRDFCLLWPGLSPPDLDERLFEAFVGHIVEACETAAASRNDGLG